MPITQELLEVANRATQPQHHRRAIRPQKQILAEVRRLEEGGCAMNKELCKYYRSWVGTSKGEINCACVDYERKIITKCDFIQNKGCWKTRRKEARNEPDKTTLHQAQPHQPSGSDLRRELQEISLLSGD